MIRFTTKNGFENGFKNGFKTHFEDCQSCKKKGDKIFLLKTATNEEKAKPMKLKNTPILINDDHI